MSKKRRSSDSLLKVDAVEARAYYLIDSNGVRRGQFTCIATDRGANTRLHIYGDDDNSRLALEVNDLGEASIQILGTNWSPGITLVVHPGRNAGIGICDVEGRPLMSLGVSHTTATGEPVAQLRVDDPNTMRSWRFPENGCGTVADRPSQ